MTEIKKCGWHACQNLPESGSVYCAGHVKLAARPPEQQAAFDQAMQAQIQEVRAEEVRVAAGMTCEPYRVAVEKIRKLLRQMPGGLVAKIEAVLKELP